MKNKKKPVNLGQGGPKTKATLMSPHDARLAKRANDEKVIRAIKAIFFSIVALAVVGTALAIFLYSYTPPLGMVGGEKVAQYEYQYFLGNMKASQIYYAQMFAEYTGEEVDPETYWDIQDEEGGPTRLEQIQGSVMGEIQTAKINLAKAKEDNLKLTAADTAEINEYMSQAEQQYEGTGNTYWKSTYGITRGQFLTCLRNEKLAQKGQEAYEAETAATDAEVQAKYDEGLANGDYDEATVHHILLEFEGPVGIDFNAPLTEEDLNPPAEGEEAADGDEAAEGDEAAAGESGEDGGAELADEDVAGGEAADTAGAAEDGSPADEDADADADALASAISEALGDTSEAAAADEAEVGEDAGDGDEAEAEAEEEEEPKRTQEETKADAEILLARVDKGEDMEALARKFSEDTGVSSNNGLYTFKRTDSYEQGFIDWAFSHEPGDTGIAETTYGYHVMRKDSGRTVPLEEVSEDLKSTISSEKYDARMEGLKADAYFNPAYSVKLMEESAARVP
jgi:hypothetical protein